MGRPTKYNEEAQQTTEKYLHKCLSKREIPYIEELALTLDVDDTTLINWSHKHPEFLATYRKIKLAQKWALKRGGLDKKLSSNIVRLLLSADHETCEKSIQDIQSKGEQILATDSVKLDQAITKLVNEIGVKTRTSNKAQTKKAAQEADRGDSK